MLPKAVEQLLLEIAECLDEQERRAFGDKSGKNKKGVQEKPEACLVSMLERIKKRLPQGSTTLGFTIEGFTYEGYLKEAEKKLKQVP